MSKGPQSGLHTLLRTGSTNLTDFQFTQFSAFKLLVINTLSVAESKDAAFQLTVNDRDQEKSRATKINGSGLKTAYCLLPTAYYSYLSATIGSTFVARRAGR